MRIALVVAAEIEKCPYLCYYTDILKQQQDVEYDIIEWRRENQVTEHTNKERAYLKASSISVPFYKKMVDYYCFSAFVRKIVKKNEYDRLIVFDIPAAIFLLDLLLGKYKKKYVIDIRDYSPIYSYGKPLFKCLLHYATFVVISSIGYKEWLPSRISYVIDHNVSSSLINEIYDFNSFRKPLRILTIGQLRDYKSNSLLMDALGNYKDIKMIFSGDGLAKNCSEDYAKKYDNVEFTGRYLKENEADTVLQSDILNIILRDDFIYNTAIANRFYLGLIYCKPMIVNSASIHAQFIERYKLGIVVSPTDDIYRKLKDYIAVFDVDLFNKGRQELLQLLKKDLMYFETNLKKFIVK